MDSIGDTLRSERLRRGLKLEQVAAQTKIGQHYLRAIEENRFDRLPGGLFTRSFLRQYTHALELNSDEIIESLKQQFEPPPVTLPESPRQRRTWNLPHLPTLGWLAITMIGCSGLYGLWDNVRRSLFDTHAKDTRVAMREGRGRDLLSPGASRLASANTLQPEPRPIEDSAPVRSAVGQLGLGSGAAAMRVVFTTSEPVWLSVKSDEINSFSGTIEGLQSREFNASTKMAVLVGNAGGLTISVNGNPVAFRGAHGEVQSLVLTPAGAHVVPRTPQAPLITPVEHSAPLDQREPPTE
jgi:transcriptional regulator with XRE-family HTH domain